MAAAPGHEHHNSLERIANTIHTKSSTVPAINQLTVENKRTVYLMPHPKLTETQRVEPAEELRQGDILQLQRSYGGDDYPALGVIINADCDLAHGKLDGVISYLPIYSFREFFSRFYAPAAVRAEKNNTITFLKEAFELDDTECDNLEQWLRSTAPDIVAEKMLGTASINKKHHDGILSKLIKLSNCIDKSNTSLGIFRKFCAQDKNPKAYAKRHIEEAKKKTADGHLFVSEIVGQPEVGFVVRMRRIYTIDVNTCFTSYAQNQSLGGNLSESAVRVACFSSLYTFRIAQLFAQQFSRIGLPDELIELGELAISDLVSQLSGDA
jgi:hypothetical protein